MYKKLKHRYDGADVVRTDMIYQKTDKLYIPTDPDNIASLSLCFFCVIWKTRTDYIF